MRRVWFAFAALLVCVAMWTLASLTVAQWLARDASQRESRWQATPSTPWQWALSPERDVVWPGSRGFERINPDDGVLAGRVGDGGVADLPLALRGGRIDPRLVSAATMRLRSDDAVRVSLSGENAGGTMLLGGTDAAAGEVVLRLPFASANPDPLWSLRLRLDAPAGTTVQLSQLELIASEDARIEDCAAQRDVERTLANCTVALPRLVAPFLWRPESQLEWRDRVLLARPGAIVRPPDAVPMALDRVPVEASRSGIGFWLLAILPLAAAVFSHLRPGRSRTRAALELALVCGPWIVLLWCGWPDPEDRAAPIWTFFACLLGALAVRDPDPDWHLVGDRRAWNAASQFALLAGAVLAIASIANAFDSDGFALRPPAGDDYLRYPLWALVQQCVLIRCIGPRLRRLVGDDAGAALAAGALFGLLHLPNFSLMLATFAAGTGWVWLGYRHRALLPLAATHAALGLLLMTLTPAWLLRSAEIGGRFLIAP